MFCLLISYEYPDEHLFSKLLLTEMLTKMAVQQRSDATSTKQRTPQTWRLRGSLFRATYLVEPEGFEPSSKHGIRCAFYMLILCLVLEIKLATNILLNP